MQRYTVHVVLPSEIDGDPPPSLIVPCESSSQVGILVGSMLTRLARLGHVLTATHRTRLHLSAIDGPIIDEEDILADVVRPNDDVLFAVITAKPPANPRLELDIDDPVATKVTVRLVTPAFARNPELAPIILIPDDAKISQLHSCAASKIGVQSTPPYNDTNECNCNLATAFANQASSSENVIVVHGKGKVERVKLPSPFEHALMSAIRTNLGPDYDNGKKVRLIGAVFDDDNVLKYTKAPVISVCSAIRHKPDGAREEEEAVDDTTTKVLDIHTSEMPIHPLSMDMTLKSSGLLELMDNNNELVVYPVVREQGQSYAPIQRKAQIYRAHPYWNPSTRQSERGLAMFLSTLRVASSLVSDFDSIGQDAVLHVFDLLLSYPPALRTLRILIDGKTPTFAECAALSNACYQVLDSFMPTDVIGTDHSRVFEGSRLLFGYVLDKAKAVKLLEPNVNQPYEAAFSTIDLQDVRTSEAVMHPVQTSAGLLERDLLKILQQPNLPKVPLLSPLEEVGEVDKTTKRVAGLAGGTCSSITIFSIAALQGNYAYPDNGDGSMVCSEEELSDLHHLAVLSGRNNLAVYRPSQLESNDPPCLSFDRSGHVAVYTGQQACAGPGESLLQFRPLHGEITINAAVIEQILAPILASHEADGTSIFDMVGDAASKRLQQPDEICCFVIDKSSSMGLRSDFAEIHQDDDDAAIVGER